MLCIIFQIKPIISKEAIVLIILSIVIVIFILFITLKFKIEIENFQFDFPKLNEKSKIKLKIYILQILKIADIDIRKVDVKNEKIKNIIQKGFKKNKLGANLNIFEAFRELNINCKKIKLIIELGTEDVAITAIGVGIVASFVGILLRNNIKNQNEQKFLVKPIYQNKNILKIQFDGIFEFNMTNII